MSAPNLFSFATSELSQDAVLAWLLAWAHPDYDGQPMHSVGSAFLGSLLATAGTAMPEGKLESVAAKRQIVVSTSNDRRRKRRIDVVAEVRTTGGRVVLLIEDKTGSPLSTNQLIDTLDGAKNRQEWIGARFAPLYLRTGNAPREHPSALAGWSLYGRSDLLKTLDEASEPVRDNAILSDFRAHIERLDRETTAFRDGIVRPWEPAAWHGYFAALEQEVYERAGHEANGIGWGHIRGEHTQGLWWTGSSVYPQITGTPRAATLSFRLRAGELSSDDRTERIRLARGVLAEGISSLDLTGRKAPANARTLSLGQETRDFRSDPLDVPADAERLIAAWEVARAAAGTHQ